MIKFSLTAILLVLATASPEARYFRYQRPIESKTTGQTCAVIPPEIFPNAARHLADLRLYRDGVETPYVIVSAAAVQSEQRSIPLLNLGRSGGKVAFDAAIPDSKFGDIELSVTGQDFIASVIVSGSEEKSGGQTTDLGTFTIFDLTRQKLGRSTVLHLPLSNFRYLHFRVDGPLNPDAFSGLVIKQVPMYEAKYQTVAETSHVVQKGRNSVFTIDVAAGIPIDRILFAPGSQPTNFNRNITISVRPAVVNGEEDPPPATNIEGSILRLHTGQGIRRIDDDQLSVSAPVSEITTNSTWTITIHNGDDAPLQMQSVSLQMLERSLCFESSGPAHLQLNYGDAALSAPQYDYASLFSAEQHPRIAEMGAESANPSYEPRPDSRPFTERHPALLWVALVVVILLLGLIAIRSARPAGKSTP